MVLKNIGVSEYVKDRLESIKKRNGHTSFDSVIRYLLTRSGEDSIIEKLEAEAEQ